MVVSSRRQFSAEKRIRRVSETTITQLPVPSGFTSDPFTDILGDGARKLIDQAIHAEGAGFHSAVNTRCPALPSGAVRNRIHAILLSSK